jgi:hypothetical protein
MQCQQSCSLEESQYDFQSGRFVIGNLTVVVIEDIMVPITHHTLATGGIGISVRAIDNFTTALDEISTGSVNEWATRALGASDSDGISAIKLVLVMRKGDEDILLAGRWQVVFFQVAAEAMAIPKVIPSIIVRSKSTLDSMRTSWITTNVVG